MIVPTIQQRNLMTKLSPSNRADQPVALYSIKNILNLANKLTNLLLYLDQKIFELYYEKTFFRKKFNVMCLYTLNPLCDQFVLFTFSKTDS